MPATCPWHDAHRSFNNRPIDPSHDKSGGRVGAGVGVGRRGAAAQPLTISALRINQLMACVLSCMTLLSVAKA
jgi:hypothetical protein